MLILASLTLIVLKSTHGIVVVVTYITNKGSKGLYKCSLAIILALSIREIGKEEDSVLSEKKTSPT